MKLLSKIGKGFFTVVGLFVVLCVLAVACSIGSTSTDDVAVKGTKDTKAKYEFVEEPVLTEGGGGVYYIEGVMKNNTSMDKEYVQVVFTLYDADGNNVGTALANITNLKADGTWKFKAMGVVTNSEVETFELDKVTGF